MEVVVRMHLPEIQNLFYEKYFECGTGKGKAKVWMTIETVMEAAGL